MATGNSAEQGNSAAVDAGAGRESTPRDAPAPAHPAAEDRTAKHRAPDRPTGVAELSREELEDRWRRALADLDNLRKRHAAELANARAQERARVAAAFLPVLDNLELALSHAEADPAGILTGVRAIRDQAVQLLAALGYPRDDEVGVPFDPRRHEVVAVDDASADAAPNTVTRVVRPGYGTDGHDLRPTAVVVSRPRE